MKDYLKQADDKFDRVTSPDILAEYKEYLKTGKYPYLANVVEFITGRHNIPKELEDKLHHEVYIAADMHRVEKMIELEQDLISQGFKPITELEFEQGKKIILQGHDKPMRLSLDGGNNWFAMPPRNTRRGYNLSAKLYEHKAYERAKQDKRTHMGGEEVVMVKELV